MHDQAEVLFQLDGIFSEQRADIQHAEAPYFKQILQHDRAAAFQGVGRYLIELHHIVRHQAVTARNQFESKLTFTDGAVAGNQHPCPAPP